MIRTDGDFNNWLKTSGLCSKHYRRPRSGQGSSHDIKTCFKLKYPPYMPYILVEKCAYNLKKK